MEFIVLLIIIFILICYFAYIFGSNKRTEKLLKKYSKIKNSCSFTGGQFVKFAYQIMNYYDCDVRYTDQKNSDCYVPKYKTIVLNKEFCFKSSLAALGVAAHEFGHCVQHKNKTPIYILTKLFKILSKIATVLFLPVLVIAIYNICVYDFNHAGIYLLLSAICLVLSFSFKLLTIPYEKNASKIGINFLKEYDLIKPSEERELRKILNAAANTYVASFYRSFSLTKK